MVIIDPGHELLVVELLRALLELGVVDVPLHLLEVLVPWGWHQLLNSLRRLQFWQLHLHRAVMPLALGTIVLYNLVIQELEIDKAIKVVLLFLHEENARVVLIEHFELL